MQSSDPPTFAEAEFRKAARSEPNRDCVRVARRDGWVAVRDDKVAYGAPDDHRLLLSAAAFDAAQDAWRAGCDGGPVELLDRADGEVTMRLASGVGPELRFTRSEIDAFLHGVAHFEFTMADGDRLLRAGERPRG